MTLSKTSVPTNIEPASSIPFYVLVSFLVVAFALGGSSRLDEPMLLLYRPLSVLALGAGLVTISRSQVKSSRIPLTLLIGGCLILFVQLIPLPSSIWTKFPGREIVSSIDEAVSTKDVYRPISLSPELTRGSLWSMCGLLATYVLAVQINIRQMQQVLILLAIIAGVSAFFSVLQAASGSADSFYIYRVTNHGLSVGIFANRNHQAVFFACMVPVLVGVLSLSFKRGKWTNSLAPVLSVISVFLVVSILLIFNGATGSRAGMILTLSSVLCVVAAVMWHNSLRMLFRTTSARGSRDKGGIGLRRGYLIATVATAGLIISFIAIAINSVAFERLRSTSLQEESRVSILGQLEQAVSAYFPLGSGFGTFDPVYRLYESSQQLAPTYWNHAHNDFFELLITGGLFGLLGLLGLALWIFVNAKKFFASRDQPLPVVVCRLIGICTVLVLLLGSVVDYPLRVPSLGCLFVLAMVLISRDWTDTRLVGRS